MSVCCCCPTMLLCISGLIFICLKIYNKLTTGAYKGKDRLDGKTVIVTGANSGIGLFCAKEFAARGAKLIMLCRDMTTAESAKADIIETTGNKQVKLKHIDFSSLTSIRKCAYELIAEEKRIDILLNNAGIGGVAKLKPTEDGLDTIMQVNHFGPFLLTNILLETIKKSPSCRIVNVSSIMHRIAKLKPNNLIQQDTSNQVIIYSNSKLANIYFTNELARLFNGTGVTVNSLHPGVFGSEITRGSSYLFQMSWKYITSIVFKSIEEGAQTSLYLCLSPEVESVSGKYFADCKMTTPSKAAQDMNMAKTIWTLSEEAVELKPNEKHY
ncbi:retinol dehydrogenase 12-like [Arctopsyche grandis]|uniref:retinol dehydrogenase 12-like n=1 Tax=Arctopsyche grandis TaxID=121162 RepID=UPI00406D8AE3